MLFIYSVVWFWSNGLHTLTDTYASTLSGYTFEGVPEYEFQHPFKLWHPLILRQPKFAGEHARLYPPQESRPKL